MEDLLDRFFEKLEASLQKSFTDTFYRYKGSFYVLIRKPRRKILNDDFKNVKSISTRIYNKFADESSMFRYIFFPYFKLIRCYGSYHYHFLIVRKDHKF